MPLAIPTCCVCGQQPKGKKLGPDKYAPYVPVALKDGTARLPRNWKWATDTDMRCPVCTQANYLPRSLRLRITGCASGSEEEWSEVKSHLNEASWQVACFANWYLQQLLAADLAMAPYAGKMPPAPEVEWYAEATKLFPAIAPRGLCTAARMVAKYYNERRFEVLVKKKRNVDTYRWDGLPVPVSSQAWKIVAIDKAILLRIQGAPGKSWLLKVFADGPSLAAMRQIVAGEAEPGAAFFVRRARAPRPGEAKGEKRKRSWFLRISGLVPKPSRKNATSTLKVLTLGHDREALLYGVTDDDNDEPLIVPAQDIREMLAGHRKRDRKRQVDATTWYLAMPARKRRRWAARRTAGCDKQQAKLDYAIKCVASHVAFRCERLGVGEVNYDTTPREWIESFPYRKLRSAITCALEARGIALHVSGAGDQDNDETMESDGHCQAEERHE